MSRPGLALAVRPLRRLLAKSTPSMGAQATLGRPASSATLASAVAAATAAVPAVPGASRLLAPPRRHLSDGSHGPPPPMSSESTDVKSAPSIVAANSDSVSFDVLVGKASDFVKELEIDLERCKLDLSVKRLKMAYKGNMEAELEIRGLLSPYALDCPDAPRLHFSYKDCLGCFPKYMTSLDLMTNLKTMAEVHWELYLDSLSKQKVLVVADWLNRLGTSSSSTHYDYGVIFASAEGDTLLSFKGESDATVKGTKGGISIIIWLGKKVYTAQLYRGIPCESEDSVQMEAMAMYLLLKRGVELGLNLHRMEVRTDCKLVYEVLSGILEIKDDDDVKGRGKHSLFSLLRLMRSKYPHLICLWLPREKLLFADDLLRQNIVMENNETRKTRNYKVQRDMVPYLHGSPVFITRDHSNEFIENLGKNEVFINDTHSCCYVQVEEDHKAHALVHIVVALRAQRRVFVALKDSDTRPMVEQHMASLFPEPVCDSSAGAEYSILGFSDSGVVSITGSGKDLVIIYDVSIPKEQFLLDGTFVVYLSTVDNKDMMVEQKIPKFGPVSFVSFSSVPERTPSRDGRRREKKLISNVSQALSILVSASSVGKDRRDFLRLVQKQLGICNSMLKKKRPDWAHIDATQDAALSALIEEAYPMLEELQKEFDEVRRQSDRDHQGTGPAENVAAAVAYLNVTIKDGGVQGLITNLTQRGKHDSDR